MQKSSILQARHEAEIHQRLQASGAMQVVSKGSEKASSKPGVFQPQLNVQVPEHITSGVMSTTLASLQNRAINRSKLNLNLSQSPSVQKNIAEENESKSTQWILPGLIHTADAEIGELLRSKPQQRRIMPALEVSQKTQLTSASMSPFASRRPLHSRAKEPDCSRSHSAKDLPAYSIQPAHCQDVSASQCFPLRPAHSQVPSVESQDKSEAAMPQALDLRVKPSQLVCNDQPTDLSLKRKSDDSRSSHKQLRTGERISDIASRLSKLQKAKGGDSKMFSNGVHSPVPLSPANWNPGIPTYGDTQHKNGVDATAPQIMTVMPICHKPQVTSQEAYTAISGHSGVSSIFPQQMFSSPAMYHQYLMAQQAAQLHALTPEQLQALGASNPHMAAYKDLMQKGFVGMLPGMPSPMMYPFLNNK